jgi:2-iminobutanoate/2-iminopropanoate deaminase
MTSTSDASGRPRIEHLGAHEDRPFSHVVRAGDWLHVSGQASTDPDTMAIIPGTFAEEFDRTIDNLRRVLALAGAGFEDVVKCVGMVRDEEDLAEYNRRYMAAFAHPRPARTTHVGPLTRIRVEIECTAYVGPRT